MRLPGFSSSRQLHCGLSVHFGVNLIMDSRESVSLACSVSSNDLDIVSRLFSHGIIALILALTFLNLGDNVLALQYRVFVMYFIGVCLSPCALHFSKANSKVI